MDALAVESLTAERLGDYLRFFDATAFTDNPGWAGCYCYFPLHDPNETNWRKRRGAENREAVSACILSGRAQGYLAYLGSEVVGWCNAGPRSLYPMLEDDTGPNAASTGIIFCFLVAPVHRGRGVAKALLTAACDGFQAQGLKIAQARPSRSAIGDAANHYGPLRMYLSAGFRIVSEDADGWVTVQKPLA